MNLFPLLLLLLALTSPAWGDWPTTIRENLPVAADTNLAERYPRAIPLTNGSILAVFQVCYGLDFSPYYQIISYYGDLAYPAPQRLAPDLPGNENVSQPQLIADSTGGAIAAWKIYNDGYYAQRLDAAGNRLWGDLGAAISQQTFEGWAQYIIPLADPGGGLVTVFQHPYWNDPNIWAKRLNPDGSLGGPPSPWAPVRTYPMTLQVAGQAVRFTLPQAGRVKLEVFDVCGRRVAGARHASPLPDAWYPAGSHEMRFDGSGLPSGIYFVRLAAGEGTAVQKVVLLK